MKLTTVVACGLAVLGLTLAGLGLFHLAGALDRHVATLSAQIAVSQSSLERQRARLRELERERARTELRFGALVRQLQAAQQRLAQLEHEAPDLGRSLDAARRSVAFLLIGYGFYEKGTGRPWRLVSIDDGAAPHPDGQEEQAEDNAVLGASYTTATGFLIAGNRIVTNRHVAEPWWEDDSAEAAIGRGFEPRYTALHAYFPGAPGPVDLRLVSVSPETDVAILEATAPVERPPLKLAPSGRRVTAGDRVIVISYPTGFEALLAKADEAVARDVRDRFGDKEPALARALADKNLIRPLVAVGHVADGLPGRIVYDAATTYGSSGGPVLNAAGEVIAVNYGGMENFAGVRFGVPVRFVQRLLNTRPDR